MDNLIVGDGAVPLPLPDSEYGLNEWGTAEYGGTSPADQPPATTSNVE